MKYIILLVLLSFNLQADDKCRVRFHKDLSKPMINFMISESINYNDLVLDNFSVSVDYGIKEVSKYIASGAFDVFGEEIMTKHSKIEVYQDGVVIAQTEMMYDMRLLTAHTINILKRINCIKAE
jgi:hypothetical protein